MSYLCDACGTVGTTDDGCYVEDVCPDEECGGTTHLIELEYTIGVCVPMRWDPATESYTISGPMTTTDGGLFSDACEGAWSPALGEWVANESALLVAAHQVAQGAVALNIGEMDP